MGKLAAHSCSPSPEHSDWFNITIDEIGEIAAYLKNNITKKYFILFLFISDCNFFFDLDIRPFRPLLP